MLFRADKKMLCYLQRIHFLKAASKTTEKWKRLEIFLVLTQLIWVRTSDSWASKHISSTSLYPRIQCYTCFPFQLPAIKYGNLKPTQFYHEWETFLDLCPKHWLQTANTDCVTINYLTLWDMHIAEKLLNIFFTSSEHKTVARTYWRRQHVHITAFFNIQNTEQIKPWTHTAYLVQHTLLASNALLYLLMRENLIKGIFVYVTIILKYLFYKTQLQVLHKNITGIRLKLWVLTQWFLAEEKKT